MFPYKKNENRVKIPSKNNLDLNDLVKHMNMSMNEATKTTADTPLMEVRTSLIRLNLFLFLNSSIFTAEKGKRFFREPAEVSNASQH